MKKSELKRENILNAAIRCIGRFGLENTSATVIAKDLGIAQSGIFYYFPTQEQLFDSLLLHIARINHAQVSTLLAERCPATHRETLLVHLEGNLRWAESQPAQVAALVHSIAKASRSPRAKRAMAELFRVGEERIRGYLDTGQAQKEFRLVAPAPQCAALMHKALMGHIISGHYERGSERPVLYYLELLEILVDSLLLAKKK